MALRWMGILLLMSAMFFSSPPVYAAANPLYDQLDKIQQALQSGKWAAVQQDALAFETAYRKRRWQLQLLGDEGEYEGINLSIHELEAAIRGKDKSQAYVILASIRGYLEDIYSL